MGVFSFLKNLGAKKQSQQSQINNVPSNQISNELSSKSKQFSQTGTSIESSKPSIPDGSKIQLKNKPQFQLESNSYDQDKAHLNLARKQDVGDSSNGTDKTNVSQDHKVLFTSTIPDPHKSISDQKQRELNERSINLENKAELPNLPRFPEEHTSVSENKSLHKEKEERITINSDELPSKREFIIQPSTNLDVSKEKKRLEFKFMDDFVSHDKLEAKLLANALKERSPYSIKAPLFITVHSYAEVLKQIQETKEFLSSASDVRFKYTEIVDKQGKYYEHWRSIIEEIQRKLLYIDKKLFENED